MTADRGEGEGEEQGRGRRGRVFALEWDTGLPLDREETDAAHRQMDIYKSTGGPHVRTRSLILVAHVN